MNLPERQVPSWLPRADSLLEHVSLGAVRAVARLAEKATSRAGGGSALPGSGLNQSNPLGMFPIHWAAALATSGAAPSIESLIAAGADPGLPSADGKRALHWAAMADHPETAALAELAGSQGSIDELEGDGFTALALAILAGSHGAAEALIHAGADLGIAVEIQTQASGRWRLTPLALALDRLTDRHEGPAVPVCEDDDIERAIAAHEAELKKHARTIQRDMELVERLLAAGADPDQPCAKTPSAARTGSEERALPAWTRMFRALSSGTIERPQTQDEALEVGRWMLRAGWAQSSLCADGRDGLHWAARHRQLSVCSMLLEAGWSAMAKDPFGETASLIARMHGEPELSEQLARAHEREELGASIRLASASKPVARL